MVNEKHIDDFYIQTKLDKYQVSVDLEATSDCGAVEFIVRDQSMEKAYRFELQGKKAIYSFNLPNDFVNDRIWTLVRPFLFDLRVRLYDEK